ncbi:uncharacterized protein B0I36DRAFT_349183 [Microdochium trichocladiopsis]|uniref:MADS-box domain-containing protein n=1 Tax=Microdochium trichocladiopsis TaxID=1682393 RepID=A0A9P8Y6Y5_9PEZI|nr:uncharacterized protein B0I36DRAFT_349183 [Microdochium trichocladiopsis]KAH7031048.1 hypothetical protein B0I36DRAFT_349183 [Microdochium trichocladiopsis]
MDGLIRGQWPHSLSRFRVAQVGASPMPITTNNIMRRQDGVMRKRRARSLRNKLMEYAALFDLKVALIVQDAKTGDYEVFQSKRNENWPPAINSIRPKIIHDIHGGDSSLKIIQRELNRMENTIKQAKVPEPPQPPADWQGVKKLS